MPDANFLVYMSKAFTREDIDPPERSGRVRSASGLPPGATNYITARGAQRLKDELARIRREPDLRERVAELERILDSVVVVDPPDAVSDEVVFGSTVTVEGANHKTQTYTVVGVDELDFVPDAVSWISPIGKSLLSAGLGDRISVDDEILGRVIKIEYRRG